ncbi:MAG: hypothetical protein FWG72_10725 [Oscillospiraceae bacterium]|nr:hypothetical protein [Oscillospiraceae bacterium]
MKGIGWKILGLFVSVALIAGGFSGDYVLRGTESSTALIVAGFGFLAWDIYAIATHGKQKRKAEEAAAERTKKSEALMAGLLGEADPQRLPAMRQIDVYLGTSLMNRAQYQLSLNGQPCGAVSLSTRSTQIQTDRVKNVLCASGEKEGKAFLFFEVTGDVEPSKMIPKPGIGVNAMDGTLGVMATQKSGLTVINPQ